MSWFEQLLEGPLIGFFGSGASDIDKLTGTFFAFFSDVTDGAMWRSMGWLMLGVAVLIFGLALWLRTPIEHAIGDTIKAVAIGA